MKNQNGENDNFSQLMYEMSLVEHYWPQFSIFDIESSLLLHGFLGGYDILKNRYEICINVPKNYPLDSPSVYIMNEDFPEGIPYFDNDKGKIDIPMYSRNNPLKIIRIHQLIALTITWLIAYETWKIDNCSNVNMYYDTSMGNPK